MSDHVALPTLLSQVLVAFTIEFDNESERRIAALGRRRVFLVSLAMWSNVMRFVGDDGVRVGDLPTLSGFPGSPVTTGWIHGALAGLERWGYIVVAPDPADIRSRPPRADWVARATPAGRAAQGVWQALAREIETRWQVRFGEREIEELRAALAALLGGLDIELPHALPVAVYSDGMRACAPHLDEWVPAGSVTGTTVGDPTDLDLSVLLSQLLLLFTIEFERESKLSLAIRADVVRVLDEQGVRVRDLPPLAGVSKEAIRASLGFLERRDLAVVEPDPAASRTKLVRLTPKGRRAQDRYWQLLDEVESRWQARHADGAIDRLRAALERLFDTDGDQPRLAQGLVPSPAGWRNQKQYRAQTEAMQRDPRAALPHHPMVLHRGGWPDGS